MHGVRPVRTVLGIVAVLPFADCQAAHVVALGQFPLRERRVADLFPDQMCGAGLAEKGLGHGAGDGVTGVNSVINRRLALK